MNKALIALLLVLLCLLSAGAAAGDTLSSPVPNYEPKYSEPGSLPTRKPADPTAAPSQMVTVVSTANPTAPKVLPNPGNFFTDDLTEPEFTDYQFAGDGRLFDVYFYSHRVEYMAEVGQFRDELDRRGIASRGGLVQGQSALTIEDGYHTAYLFIDYTGNGVEEFMFMVEHGFEMDEQVPVVHTLDLGDVLLQLNGSTYEYEGCVAVAGTLTSSRMVSHTLKGSSFGSYSYGNQYSVYYTQENSYSAVLSVNADSGEVKISFGIPHDVQSGFYYHADSSSLSTDLYLSLLGKRFYGGSQGITKGNYSYGGSSFGKNHYYNGRTEYYNLMSADSDYLIIQVNYRDDRELQGSLDGLFENGTTAFHIDFWVPIK